MGRRLLCLALFALAGLGLLFLFDGLAGQAAPLQQPPPPAPVVLVSNEGQYPDNLVDKTLVRDASADPDPSWRDRFFDVSGWQDAYPSMRASAWTSGGNIDPLLNQGADHIWGGAPGALQTDAGNFTEYARRLSGGTWDHGYALPAAPSPQYLFVHKKFCMPINAQADAQRRLTAGGGSLSLLNATDTGGVPDGAASVWMNTVALGVVPGNESDTVAGLPVLPNFLYRGLNALTLRAADARSDERAAILYGGTLDYTIDPNALWIDFTPANPLLGDTISFAVNQDGLSDRPAYTYNWDFGGAGARGGSDTNPTYLYDTAGTYTVTLIVVDSDGCSGQASTVVVVEGTPLVVDKRAVPSDVVYTGDSLHYFIDVSNIGGSDLSNIIVTDPLPPNTTYVANSCSPLPCSQSGGVVQWDLASLAAGTSVTLDFFVTVGSGAANTNLVNTAQAVSGSFSDSDSVTVPVEPGCVPLDAITISGPTTGQAGTVYNFGANYTPAGASTPVGYLWDDGGTGATSSRTFAAPGIYTLVVTATNACSLVTGTHTIDIAAACVPVTGVTLNQLTPNPVVGAPVDFSADVLPGGATPNFDYRLTVDGTPGAVMNAGASPINFSQTFATAGAHTVQIAVWNCSLTEANAVTATLPVDVEQGCVPLTGVTIAGPTTGQTGTTYSFSANYTPDDATAPTFLWDNGDVTQTSGRAFAAPGTYTLQVTVENGCSQVQDEHTIVVSRPAPTSPPPPPPTAQPTPVPTSLPTPAYLPVSGGGDGTTGLLPAALSLPLLLGVAAGLALLVKRSGRPRPS